MFSAKTLTYCTFNLKLCQCLQIRSNRDNLIANTLKLNYKLLK